MRVGVGVAGVQKVAVGGQGLVLVAQFFQGLPLAGVGPDIVGIEGDDLFGVGQGRLRFVQGQVGQAPVVQDVRRLRVQFQGPVIILEGLLGLLAYPGRCCPGCSRSASPWGRTLAAWV